MDYRKFGGSGLSVPVLSFGTATFGGTNGFETWGSTNASEARHLVDVCLDHGLNLFDSANVYSNGLSEEILGAAVKGRRNEVLISTKATLPMNSELSESGSSRHSIVHACESSLRRLGTNHIDIYYMHGFDATTPVEETLRVLDDLVGSGKIRYIGCSNFSGWHIMKSLAISDRYGWSRYVVNQAYYSLASREYEWELMPLALTERVGTVAWGPLAGGALAGKLRRGAPPSPGSRVALQGMLPSLCTDQKLHEITDVVHDIAQQTGKTMSQIALHWVLQRPSVVSVVIGARNVDQLKQNLGVIGWSLDAAQLARLDSASEMRPIYPYWHQREFKDLNPPPVPMARDDDL